MSSKNIRPDSSVRLSRADHQIGCLAMIWAQDRNGVLGADGGMVWHVPDDFKHFKEMTLGHSVIMGRASFEALGKPLEGRRNVVLTRQSGYSPAGVEMAANLDEAFTRCAGEDLVWIAGGARVYREALEYADRLVISRLDLEAKVASGKQIARAPEVSVAEWSLDESHSDSDWRPVSGDARWKVEEYLRR